MYDSVGVRMSDTDVSYSWGRCEKKTNLPVCMLTKTLLALNATLSQRPETKEHSRIGRSEWDGSISWRIFDMKPSLGAVFDSRGIVDESDETLALNTPGVPEGDCVDTGPVVAIWILSSFIEEEFEEHGSLSCAGLRKLYRDDISALENISKEKTLGQKIGGKMDPHV